MNSILVPTDYSPAAENAMNYALQMAGAYNTSVTLLHVYSVPISMTEVPVMLLSVEELEKNAETQILALKRKVEDRNTAHIPINTITKLGDTIDELSALCDELQPFAVVMGTRGASGMESLFGSTTLSAVKRLQCPVLCIPPDRNFGNGIKRIGFACDFRNVLETTPAAAIREVVQQCKATLAVLNINATNEQEDERSKEMQMLKTMLADVNPSFHVLRVPDVEEGIHAFAAQQKLDIVITIPKKHKLLEGLFKKSATRMLVLHAHIPIMCIHED